MLEKLKKTLSDKKAKKVQKDQSGFTIIEVMIVLAIAALILVIVFLAVPALQRSSRNTQRDSDATNALAALNTYVSNHNGTLPTVASCGDATCFTNNIKLGIFKGNVTYETESNYSAPANNDNYDNLYILTGATCSTDGTTVNPTPSTRAFAAVYDKENNTPHCVEG